MHRFRLRAAFVFLAFALAAGAPLPAATPEAARAQALAGSAQFQAAVAEENAARATTFGKMTAELDLIGERPSGLTPPKARSCGR